MNLKTILILLLSIPNIIFGAVNIGENADFAYGYI